MQSPGWQRLVEMIQLTAAHLGNVQLLTSDLKNKAILIVFSFKEKVGVRT